MKKLVGGFALASAAVAAYALIVRPWLLRWGTTEVEAERALPGDDLVPNPVYKTTRAITINASAAQVWQWLVQIGVGRGGFYTYDDLENMAGLGIQSADRIHPEWQTLSVGDSISISPVTPLKIEVFEPTHALVLYIAMNPFTAELVDANDPAIPALIDWTWAFALEESAPMTTRLIVRVRANLKPDTLRFVSPILLEPIHFVMERGMFQGIKARAEKVSA